MRVMYNDNEIANVYTNRSITVEEAIYAIGYDVNDPEDCEKAYVEGFKPAYLDDCGNYQIDTENCELVY